MLAALFFFQAGNIYAYDKEELFKIVALYEKKYNIPARLLWSIAQVESGIKPFALNVAGKTIIASNKEEAVRVAEYYLGQGINNIDVGLLQINLIYHKKNFADLSDCFDIDSNIRYGASYLRKLYDKHGSWQAAVRYYHSKQVAHHLPYGKKILLAWINNEKPANN